MLVASSKTQEKSLAWLTEKSQAPFSCPECNSEVILKKGKVRAHHFAHKPPVDCIYGVGESQKHLTIKRQVYEALVNHHNCSRCELDSDQAYTCCAANPDGFDCDQGNGCARHCSYDIIGDYISPFGQVDQFRFPPTDAIGLDTMIGVSRRA